MENRTLTGLGTFPVIVSQSKFYNIKGKISLPTIGAGSVADSAVVVTANVNGGSTFYTGTAGAEGFETGAVCNSGDTINVILTSAAAVDQGLNIIKTTLSIY